MRYIINDDDIEDWYKILKEAMDNKDWDSVEYVINELDAEISHGLDMSQRINSIKG